MDSFWIKHEENKLIFTDYCPNCFCNKMLLEVGVTLQDISPFSTIQCNNKNNGVGYMCSECPYGYSSVFRGFQCADCDGPWYLLVVPLYALGGVALIALLFLFNLTVSQGTVNGISFYANIMYLCDDHLRHSVKP